MNQYLGVSASGDRWKVQLCRKNKVYYLGLFEELKQAAQVADVSALITQAWSRSLPRTNFTTSQATQREEWSDLQKAMVDDLRLRFPADERRHSRKDAVDMFMPDVLIEEADAIRVNSTQQEDRLQAFIASVKQSLSRMAFQLDDATKSRNFYRDQCLSMTLELENFRRVHQTKDAKPKLNIVLRRVAGTPTAEELAQAAQAEPTEAAPEVIQTPLAESAVQA